MATPWRAGQNDQDVTTLLSPSGAWVSGAVVSAPADLNAFIRAYLGLRFFGPAQQREQMRFVPGGRSSPPGPGQNAAGLALFRYRTRCGAVYGHTGNFPGYVQFAAATADGRRAVTTSLNIAAPDGQAAGPVTGGPDDRGVRVAAVSGEMRRRSRGRTTAAAAFGRSGSSVTQR